MTNQEILDNAPPSATHVDIHNHYWRIEDGDYWMIRVNIRWEYTRVDNSMRELADIKRIAELEKFKDYYQEIVEARGYYGITDLLVADTKHKERIAELEKELEPLSFSEYETIVDINNHNYARYEALIEGNYIKALKEQG